MHFAVNMPNVNKCQQGNEPRTQTCKGTLSKASSMRLTVHKNVSLRKRQY